MNRLGTGCSLSVCVHEVNAPSEWATGGQLRLAVSSSVHAHKHCVLEGIPALRALGQLLEKGSSIFF